MPWFVSLVIIIVILGFIIGVTAFGFWLYGSYQEGKHCAQWENKRVWQQPYTYYVMAGKVMVPMYTPGQWVNNTVCIKLK